MSYNYKKIEYPNGQTQVRLYSQPILDSKHYLSVDENGVFTKGYSLDVDRSRKADGEQTEEQKEHSIRTSTNRSKMNICELARSNNWEWFCTFTFNDDICNGYSFEDCRKKVTTYFNNLKKRKCPNVKYLGVPEQHKSGRWHFHILVSDIDEITNSFTQAINPYTNEPIEGVYNMNGSWSYGFSTVSKVKDTKKASSYIMKYITKEMIADTKEKHRFFIPTI